MERATVAVYEDRGEKWALGTKPDRADSARSFAQESGRSSGPSSLRIDVGCGAGRYTGLIGTPCIGFDAARKMLDLCRQAVPDSFLVQGDMEALPFSPRSIDGAWANMSYLHLPRESLPAALADLHRCLRVGSLFDIQVMHGEWQGSGMPEDSVGGRYFAAWQEAGLVDVLTGAGFGIVSTETVDSGPSHRHVVRARARRLRTLPDTVGAGMGVLVCGLNPSLYAADAGFGFARPGNRFWRAALAAGLVASSRDPRRALSHDKVGMTDMVKRATQRASELSDDEYRAGADRVERLVRWLQPSVTCFVGLAGWRAAVEPDAVAGIQGNTFGGRPAYVMPSTSGLNARSTIEDLTCHLRRVADMADARP